MARAAKQRKVATGRKRKPAAKDPLRLRLRLVLGNDVALGPGKADLLELIRVTGSIAAAGRAMGMSYKRAWSLVTTMNRSFATPLVAVSRGGSGHGGAELTEVGIVVLSAYRRLMARLETSADLAAIRALLASP